MTARMRDLQWTKLLCGCGCLATQAGVGAPATAWGLQADCSPTVSPLLHAALAQSISIESKRGVAAISAPWTWHAGTQLMCCHLDPERTTALQRNFVPTHHPTPCVQLGCQEQRHARATACAATVRPLADVAAAAVQSAVPC